jgi:hypothetical protein
MKRKLAAAGLGISLGTGACATEGRGLDNDVAVKLAPPVTSRTDVKALFGKPAMMAPIQPALGACIEEWRYFGAPAAPMASLVVRFDRAASYVLGPPTPTLQRGPPAEPEGLSGGALPLRIRLV